MPPFHFLQDGHDAMGTKSKPKINLVGSNVFGQNPYINNQQTFNMMVSDDKLVAFPGYAVQIKNYNPDSKGRGAFPSLQGGFFLRVIDNIVYKVRGPRGHLNQQPIFELNTYTGNVFMAENIASQIGIVDGKDYWVYNYETGNTVPVELPPNSVSGAPMLPGFITYHDGYFIISDSASNQWPLTQQNQATNLFWGASSTPVIGSIQTKPDNTVAVVRAPGKGNLIYVFGQTVMEMWYDVGLQLFPYQRNNSISIDYGCLSSGTIAAMDNYVAFLGVNEQSGPVIMISTGGGFTPISTDGIDYRLAQLVNPSKSTAFFYQINGHVLYQITFYDPRDNVTHVYDFKTQKFYFATDENTNYHIAQNIAFFNNTNYFVSLNDGSLYEMNSVYTTYDYRDPVNPSEDDEFTIPRIRYFNTIRDEEEDVAVPFIIDNISMEIEQGIDKRYQGPELEYICGENGYTITGEAPYGYIGNYISNESTVNDYTPYSDMAISKDGGESFGNFIRKEMHPLGLRKNKLLFRRMGMSNDYSGQIRWWTRGDLTVGAANIQVRVKS